MRYDDAGQTVELQDGAGDVKGGFRVQRGGRLVHQQDGRFAQQASCNGDALLFAAGQTTAVFAAEVILSACGNQGAQTGKSDRFIDFRFIKFAEHRDIIPDGAIEDKDVLLHDGDKIVKGFRADVVQLRTVIENVATVVAAACHEEIEHGRFTTAGAADNGVAFTCFKARADAVQDFLARFIREGDIF